jgi:N-acetyl-alpha-D-muramate 1-phosphate uridylyltransferase
MVLAAGRGERLRPLTDSVPKPLIEVGGRPLIAWHLQALRRAGFREVVVNLSWLGEQLRAVLGDGRDFGLTLHYSDEGPVALETGGGILKALPLLGAAPFLVVSADIFTALDFGRLRLEAAALAHLILVPNPAHHPRGDFALRGELVGLGEPRLTYGNVGIYRPEFFAGCTAGRFPLVEPLKRAIAQGAVRGELFTGQWSDVGTPARLAELNSRLAQVE